MPRVQLLGVLDPRPVRRVGRDDVAMEWVDREIAGVTENGADIARIEKRGQHNPGLRPEAAGGPPTSALVQVEEIKLRRALQVIAVGLTVGLPDHIADNLVVNLPRDWRHLRHEPSDEALLILGLAHLPATDPFGVVAATDLAVLPHDVHAAAVQEPLISEKRRMRV